MSGPTDQQQKPPSFIVDFEVTSEEIEQEKQREYYQFTRFIKDNVE